MSERYDREESALAEASRLFNDLTKPQSEIYRRRVVDLAPYRGSPKWLRDRETAQKEFAATTEAAARVSDLAYADMIARGEVSQATYDEFEKVLALVSHVMAEAAE